MDLGRPLSALRHAKKDTSGTRASACVPISRAKREPWTRTEAARRSVSADLQGGTPMLHRIRPTFTALAILALLVVTSTAGFAVSGRSADRAIQRTKDAAGNLDEVSASILEQAGARYAPGTSVPGSAFLAAFQQGRALPLVGGALSALAVQANGTLWAGAADGGVWKSTNGGNSWTPKFDTQGSLSIGAIAINPADQSVWV